MSYYIRILGTQDPNVHLNEIIAKLKSENLNAAFYLGDGDKPQDWELLEVLTPDGETLFQIERNSTDDEELGTEEIQEFMQSVEQYQPASAAKWLKSYFNKVEVIYSFELTELAVMSDENMLIVDKVREAIWDKTGGILQSDDEGFTNEDGYHILWQFDEDAEDDWNMAVLNEQGQWETFMMDLGNPDHRKAFMAGKVPQGVERS